MSRQAPDKKLSRLPDARDHPGRIGVQLAAVVISVHLHYPHPVSFHQELQLAGKDKRYVKFRLLTMFPAILVEPDVSKRHMLQLLCRIAADIGCPEDCAIKLRDVKRHWLKVTGC